MIRALIDCGIITATIGTNAALFRLAVYWGNQPGRKL